MTSAPIEAGKNLNCFISHVEIIKLLRGLNTSTIFFLVGSGLHFLSNKDQQFLMINFLIINFSSQYFYNL